MAASQCGMNTGKNTSHLRYADVLLIYAETTLGAAASTNDASALEAFNAVEQGGRTVI